MLLGAPDSGKTTLARDLLGAAIEAGKTAAYVDADIDQATTGPPACIGLKYVTTPADLDRLADADGLHFVGSTTPDPVILQQVAATAAQVGQAQERCDLVVVDTTGAVSGVVGQTLKYHKMELCRPDVIVGLQRGGELEPLVGMLRRFFTAEVELAPVDPGVRPSSPEDRQAHRAKAFARAFEAPLQRWRVRSTVFAPTIPAGLDLSRLDGVLVGLQDGSGACLGLGVLEFAEDHLRVVTNTGDGMRGLRLGSLRIDLESFSVHRLRLREVMFGVD